MRAGWGGTPGRLPQGWSLAEEPSPRLGRLNIQVPAPGPQSRDPGPEQDSGDEQRSRPGLPRKSWSPAVPASRSQPKQAGALTRVMSSLRAAGGKGRSPAGALRTSQAPPPHQLSCRPCLPGSKQASRPACLRETAEPEEGEGRRGPAHSPLQKAYLGPSSTPSPST